jgi:hypothetical protein
MSTARRAVSRPTSYVSWRALTDGSGPDRRASTANSAPEHRAPKEFESWELIRAYRHAYQLSLLCPNVMLARELANFLYRAQAELQRRDEWRPDYLQSA